ncbi:intradiol ring-cleavage dioxygenase [Roseateles puraquae]|uniref:dioxygenase family protein n=1 Tax=Roseateles puraquae TaxID=431059 RepID=UPI0031D97827
MSTQPPAAKAATGPTDPSRRRGLLTALGGLGSLGATALIGCGGGGTTASSTDTSGTLSLDDDTEEGLTKILAAAATCTVAATETEGPYPLRAILANTTMVRADLTEGKTGVPLTLRIKLVDVNNACAAIAGAWVYIWHCDKDGLYSGYDASNNAGQANLTYLRGIQQSDSNGLVTFKTVYPGWYAGRITHVHCMVFLAGTTLSSTSASMATTQFAFPLATTATVYGSTLYSKGQNTSVTSFAADNVFSDGTSTEMLALSGSVKSGYVGGIVLGIDQTASNGGGGSDPGPTPPGTPPTPPGPPPIG